MKKRLLAGLLAFSLMMSLPVAAATEGTQPSEEAAPAVETIEGAPQEGEPLDVATPETAVPDGEQAGESETQEEPAQVGEPVLGDSAVQEPAVSMLSADSVALYATPKASGNDVAITDMAGITVNLFNYTVNSSGKDEYGGGINNGHTFKFTDGSYNRMFASRNNYLNVWVGNQPPASADADYKNNSILRNIVQEKLGTDGYPTLTQGSYTVNYGGQWGSNAFNVTTNGESLAYLFNGTTSNYKSAYMGVEGLFYKTKDGYYEYNSETHAATYNNNRIEVVNGSNGGFYPFGESVYHFGLNVSFDFIQPQNGKINNEDMVFEFSGDDDMWVFVDGVLVLDLGGIHGNRPGSINFSTGEVLINGASADEATSNAKYGGEVTSLGTIFGLDGNTFDDFTSHHIDIFYLERGKGDSNCKIRFNIPTIPKADLAVSKTVDGDGFEVGQTFTFALKDSDNAVVANQAYTVYNLAEWVEKPEGAQPVSTNQSTNEDGQFTLESGQVAVFSDMFDAANQDATYTVKEITNGISSKLDSVRINGAVADKEDASTTASYQNHIIQFVNKPVQKGAVAVKKEVDGVLTDIPVGAGFTFKLMSGDTVIGTATASQSNNWQVTFYNVPAGNYTIEESGTTGVDSKYTLNDTAFKVDGTVVEDGSITVTAGGTTTVECTNTYAYTVGSLKITKAVDGIANGDLGEVSNKEFSFTVTPGNDVEMSGYTVPEESKDIISIGTNHVLTVKVTGKSSVTVANLPIGTYTVTENVGSDMDLNSYYYVGNSLTSNNSVTANVTANDTSQVTVINYYKKYLTLTVKKEVAGNMGDTSATFGFTASIKRGDDEIFVGNAGNFTLADMNSSAEGVDISWTYNKLKEGDVVTVTENDANGNGYSTSITVNGNTYAQSSREYSTDANGIRSDTTVIFTNTKQIVTPTGVNANAAPYLVMVGVALAAGAWLLVRRRRELE